MNKYKIKYLVISDIHLGHRKVKTSFIINNLDIFFRENYKEFKDLDFIFLAGDVYDRLLNHSSNEVNEITAWLIRLIQFCIKHNIKLRLLKGTPSHEWDQLANIDTIIKESKLEIDFKYIDDIYIEENIELGINILYIPDEARHTPEETFEVVELLMKKKHIDKVDIVIMHGQFHYQIPQVKLDSSHDEDKYLSITKYLIHPGHIHKHSIFDRIVAQGSFDRLIHNEEEPKGAILANIYRDGKFDYKFIKNKHAKIFKTIKIKSTTLEKAIEEIKKKIIKYPADSFIALDLINEELLKNNLKDIKKLLPDYHFSIKKKKSKEKNDKILEEKIELDNVLNITEDNIEELIKERIDNLSLEELSILISELDKIKGG